MLNSKYRGTVVLSSLNGLSEGLGWMILTLIVSAIGTAVTEYGEYLILIQLFLTVFLWCCNYNLTDWINPDWAFFTDRRELLMHRVSYIGFSAFTASAIAVIEWLTITTWWGFIVAGVALLALKLTVNLVHPKVSKWCNKIRVQGGLVPGLKICPHGEIVHDTNPSGVKVS